MRKQLLLARILTVMGLTVVASPAVQAAGCMDEVERVAQSLGLSKSLPGSIPGLSKGEAPATTESRGIPPEVTSRLTGTGTPSANPAGRQGEALGLLQSARAASAQGNEPECFAQLAKARSMLGGK
ncbi:MAG TPA: hypothetical protein VGB82_02505 [Alphaproteobacteria bacterium]